MFEGLPTAGIKTKMVYASTPKHGGLDTRLGIARHLEHIELTLAADGHDHHPFACMTSVVPIVVLNFGIKRLLIKADKSLHIRRQDCDVVHTIYQCSHCNTPQP